MWLVPASLYREGFKFKEERMAKQPQSRRRAKARDTLPIQNRNFGFFNQYIHTPMTPISYSGSSYETTMDVGLFSKTQVGKPSPRREGIREMEMGSDVISCTSSTEEQYRIWEDLREVGMPSNAILDTNNNHNNNTGSPEEHDSSCEERKEVDAGSEVVHDINPPQEQCSTREEMMEVEIGTGVVSDRGSDDGSDESIGFSDDDDADEGITLPSKDKMDLSIDLSSTAGFGETMDMVDVARSMSGEEGEASASEDGSDMPQCISPPRCFHRKS